jgi:SET domain-containing protein
LIGEYATYIPTNIGRKLTNGMYETDILGRYCNHSTDSNTSFIYENDSILLYANTDINIGDEIVVNYFDFEKLTGVIYPHNWSIFDNTILTKFGS